MDYSQQQRQRLDYMPWLYASLKPSLKREIDAWQKDWQQQLMDMETLVIEAGAYIASTARLFAEPQRAIHIASGCLLGADCFLHGPITLGEQVSINHHASLDGGRAGIVIGAHSRLAAYTSLYAFNHRMAQDKLIREQPVASRGIRLGEDVWLGAHAGVVDGVTIGNGTVVGMGAIVTKDAPAAVILAGNPAQIIGTRADAEQNKINRKPAR